MEYVIILLVVVAISWVVLMAVLPLARMIVDFSLPPFGEMAWRAAVIVVAGTVVDLALSPVHGWLAVIAGIIVYFVLMHKLFDAEILASIVISVIAFIVRLFLVVLALRMVA
jgi:hypothetical protein